eukprot:scaffold274467_cov34-Tisochrysis_lutea.AAC.1
MAALRGKERSHASGVLPRCCGPAAAAPSLGGARTMNLCTSKGSGMAERRTHAFEPAYALK